MSRDVIFSIKLKVDSDEIEIGGRVRRIMDGIVGNRPIPSDTINYLKTLESPKTWDIGVPEETNIVTIPSYLSGYYTIYWQREMIEAWSKAFDLPKEEVAKIFREERFLC